MAFTLKVTNMACRTGAWHSH